MDVYKVKQAEIPSLRKKLLKDQKGLCALCEKDLILNPKSKACLDHCHRTGHVRAVLCSTCNESEGRLQGISKYKHIKEDPIPFVYKVIDYITKHQKQPSGLIHPTFDLDLGKQKPKKRRRKKTK